MSLVETQRNMGSRKAFNKHYETQIASGLAKDMHKSRLMFAKAVSMGLQ